MFKKGTELSLTSFPSMEMRDSRLKQYNNRNKLCISLKHLLLIKLLMPFSGERGAALDDEDEKK